MQKERKYCQSCFRRDWHAPVKLNRVTTILLHLVTLGLIRFVWPYRCVTCGTARPRSRWGDPRTSSDF